MRMSCFVPVVSETAANDEGGCVTACLAPTSSTVGAELTLPTNTTGATAGLETVTAAAELPAETVTESEVESEVESWLAGFGVA